MLVSYTIPLAIFVTLLLSFSVGNTISVYKGLVTLQNEVDQELRNLNAAIKQEWDQQQITELREGYNELVFIWNNCIGQFPEMILAKFFHFREKELSQP